LKVTSACYKGPDAEECCNLMCGECNITPPLSNDHEIDAVISAVTAVAPMEDLCGQNDYCDLLKKLGDGYSISEGFRLLKILPRSTHVRFEDFERWMERCENY